MTINCNFRLIPEYVFMRYSTEPKLRSGRYHNSHFSNIKPDQFPVAVYIDGNISELKAQGMTVEQIIDSFLEQLNEPIAKKKKKTIREFGLLTRHSYECKVDSEGKEFIIAILLTDDKKNKNFFGEGYERNERYKTRRSRDDKEGSKSSRPGRNSENQLLDSPDRNPRDTGTDLENEDL